jgi:hypothetical protein
MFKYHLEELWLQRVYIAAALTGGPKTTICDPMLWFKGVKLVKFAEEWR